MGGGCDNAKWAQRQHGKSRPIQYERLNDSVLEAYRILQRVMNNYDVLAYSYLLCITPR